MVADANTDETHWLETESTEDWVTTQHDQVYFRNEGEFRLYADSRKLLKAAAAVAESVPEDWDVVVTAGPYRGYDVSYEVNSESRHIHLDFYSIRPGFQHLADVIQDIEMAVRPSSGNETEAGA